MRRFPAIGLAISLLALPLAARAVVPDPRFQGALVGGTGPATIATAVGDVTGDGAPDLIVARGADAGAEAYTIAVFDGPLSGALPTAPTFTVTPSAHSDAYRLAVGELRVPGCGGGPHGLEHLLRHDGAHQLGPGRLEVVLHVRPRRQRDPSPRPQHAHHVEQRGLVASEMR